MYSFFLIGFNFKFVVDMTQLFDRERKPNLEAMIGQTIREENRISVTSGLTRVSKPNNYAFFS